MAQAGKTKRKDKNRVLLKTGETQRPNGLYMYRWTDEYGRRQSTYAQTLTELREKEKEIERDKIDNISSIGRTITVDNMYDTWMSLKHKIKDTTRKAYESMYRCLIKPKLGQMPIVAVKKSDIRKFYNYLLEEKDVSIHTLCDVNAMLGPMFSIAVDDGYIRTNPTSGCLKAAKKSTDKTAGRRVALTRDQQMRFVEYVNNHSKFQHWSPLFTVLLGTGLRINEALALCWNAVDLEAGTIHVNYTLSYTNSSKGSKKTKCSFHLTPPKTRTSKRIIPMTQEVREAFKREIEAQRAAGIVCNVTIDGHNDFVFVNSKGNVHLARTVNQGITAIVKHYNAQHGVEPLPQFSCHVLRHTFATRMCEAGVNIKAVQSIMGHADIAMTMDIYTDATEDFKRREIESFEQMMNGVNAMQLYTNHTPIRTPISAALA